MKIKKIKPSIIGLIQTLGVFMYCFLISLFFSQMKNFHMDEGQIWPSLLMLFLLVISVAIVGTLMFGYPAYLIINKEIKKSLTILGYTFLYSIIIFCTFLIIIIK
ncbi:MAG: hypothetical protein PHZ07_05245 [Patescibacteria group bacterium]|nr:hypothetical protein [Patescibacteria group bacterium]MDD4304834.1 hypothetical protein [Patescibacteria group bacterium]MDD4695804.1 hypothetical protein [Patescibacteria group bacterium]